MAQMIVDKPIREAQLCYELGGVPLMVDGDEVHVRDVDQATLEAAVEAHVADEGWVHPDPPPPSRDQVVRAKGIEGFQDLKAIALDTNQQAIVRRIARDTAWALRGLYAELRDEDIE